MIPLSALPQKLGIYKSCILLSTGALTAFLFIIVTPYKLTFSLSAGAFVCVIYPSTLAALSMKESDKNETLWATGMYSIFYSLGSTLGPFVTGIAMSLLPIGILWLGLCFLQCLFC